MPHFHREQNRPTQSHCLASYCFEDSKQEFLRYQVAFISSQLYTATALSTNSLSRWHSRVVLLYTSFSATMGKQWASRIVTKARSITAFRRRGIAYVSAKLYMVKASADESRTPRGGKQPVRSQYSTSTKSGELMPEATTTPRCGSSLKRSANWPEWKARAWRNTLKESSSSRRCTERVS